MSGPPMFNQGEDPEKWAQYLRNEPEAIQINFFSGGRSVIVTLEARGDVVARDYGGPVYHMGEQINVPGPTVNAWRSSPRPDLHAKILHALADLRFPDVPLAMLYPDEHASSFGLVHRNGASAAVTTPRRFFDDKPILHALEMELDAICCATQSNPPTHTLPNPDAM